MLATANCPHSSTYGPSAGMPACPHCQGDVMRIGRRPVDRVASWFAPARRYQCLSFHCQWEGNVRRLHAAATSLQQRSESTSKPGLHAKPRGHERTTSRSFVVCMLFCALGIAFVLAAGTTDWFSPDDTKVALSSEGTWQLYPALVAITRGGPAPAAK